MRETPERLDAKTLRWVVSVLRRRADDARALHLVTEALGIHTFADTLERRAAVEEKRSKRT